MADAQRPQTRLEQSVELGMLLACYGGLLTDKQREALRMHCDEDLTLAEIAEEMAVSRQNVHELIVRSEQKLRRYEDALQLAGQLHHTREQLTAALTALDAGQPLAGRDIIHALLVKLDEEELEGGV